MGIPVQFFPIFDRLIEQIGRLDQRFQGFRPTCRVVYSMWPLFFRNSPARLTKWWTVKMPLHMKLVSNPAGPNPEIDR
ncbi:hypothetical protein TNCT_290071 [Trichonephila clavata]|uniref:Uncharacterized protein n=1 Tax=Trichonephila clavata TaxID=2740835 RepID=A0A8X6GNK6_TRICU|nr:hypothetical protein TNCT_290071 [Trichonephila clavata]